MLRKHHRYWGLLLPFLLSSCSWVFFFPSKELFHTPSELGVQYEELTFESRDGTKLLGWWLPAEGEEKGTILFLHGNAENISTHIGSVYWLPKRGYSVFLFDYRGYGASQGNPSMDGSLEDIAAAMRYLREVRKKPFHVFAQSLGGSLAILAISKSAEKNEILSITVEGAFSSFRGILADKVGDFWLLWPIQWLPGLFVPTTPPIDAIVDLPARPLLIIHGEEDPVVPSYHACRLYEHACPPKELLLVPHGHHGDTFQNEEYRERFIVFLQQAQKSDSAS